MTHHTQPKHTSINNAGITHSDLTDETGSQSILTQVHKGMKVYDVNDQHIGSVAFVHFGAANETQQELGVGPATSSPADAVEPRTRTIFDGISEVFDPTEVPEELRDKLLYSGYVRLDTAGLFASDRFITPDQIVNVADEDVHLSVNKDQLVKKH